MLGLRVWMGWWVQRALISWREALRGISEGVLGEEGPRRRIAETRSSINATAVLLLGTFSGSYYFLSSSPSSSYPLSSSSSYVPISSCWRSSCCHNMPVLLIILPRKTRFRTL